MYYHLLQKRVSEKVNKVKQSVGAWNRLLATLHFLLVERRSLWVLLVVIHNHLVDIGSSSTLRMFEKEMYNKTTTLWQYEQEAGMRLGLITIPLTSLSSIPITQLPALTNCFTRGTEERMWRPGILATHFSIQKNESTGGVTVSTDEQIKARAVICNLPDHSQFIFEPPSFLYRCWYLSLSCMSVIMVTSIIQYIRFSWEYDTWPGYNSGSHIRVCCRVVQSWIVRLFVLASCFAAGAVSMFTMFAGTFLGWYVGGAGVVLKLIVVVMALDDLRRQQTFSFDHCLLDCSELQIKRRGIVGFLAYPSWIAMREMEEKTREKMLLDKYQETGVKIEIERRMSAGCLDFTFGSDDWYDFCKALKIIRH